MSSDVIIGYHGKPRCAWAGAGDTAFGRYHDEVWGTRTYDESAMFKALTLGVFEVGLSWSIVFGKRDAFRTAFQGFDVARVAAMTGQDVDRLMEDASIIRNHGKIQATVDNARAMMSASPSLVALARSYEITSKRALGKQSGLTRRAARPGTTMPSHDRLGWLPNEARAGPRGASRCTAGTSASGQSPRTGVHVRMLTNVTAGAV
jgi:DNA-3-methyladenine glycosylase I